MSFLLLLSCALRTQRTGLVTIDEQALVLVEPTGRPNHLVVQGEGAWLHGLEGFVVEAHGPRWGRKLWVRDYEVLEGPDGSAPYFGVLRRHGSNLILDDRTTGQPVLLDQVSALQLNDLVGAPVAITGFVSGPQTITVVEVRNLSD